VSGATASHRRCELYVDAAGDDAVLGLLRKLFRTDDRLGSFALDGLEVDVGRNDLPTEEADPDDFVNWRAVVEISAGAETTDDRMVAFVADLMTSLRAAGHRVVAACDFEDELPQTDLV
jgi:hypothetical protein